MQMKTEKKHKIIIKAGVFTSPGLDLVLRDERLSWKARGLLIYMLTLPTGWTKTITELAKIAPDGRDSVRAGIRELIRAGYIRKTVAPKRRGGVEYRVHDKAE